MVELKKRTKIHDVDQHVRPPVGCRWPCSKASSGREILRGRVRLGTFFLFHFPLVRPTRTCTLATVRGLRSRDRCSITDTTHGQNCSVDSGGDKAAAFAWVTALGFNGAVSGLGGKEVQLYLAKAWQTCYVDSSRDSGKLADLRSDQRSCSAWMVVGV